MKLSFDDAFLHILRVEGTHYTNIPEDRGGPTKFGITQEDYALFLMKPANAEMVKKMTIDEAKSIYRMKYWDAIHGDDITSPILALVIFDQAVNRGVRTAIKQIQRQVGVTPDGVMGHITIGAINFQQGDAAAFKYVCDAQDFYCGLVAKNPSQIVFLKGWINRTQLLFEIITGLKGAY